MWLTPRHPTCRAEEKRREEGREKRKEHSECVDREADCVLAEVCLLVMV